MKERAFRQPLSTGAQAVLKALRPARPRPNQLAFPGPKGGPMSNMAMDMMLRDLAPGFTPHGMRSTFRDWAGDEANYARETIEECLAHAVGGGWSYGVASVCQNHAPATPATTWITRCR